VKNYKRYYWENSIIWYYQENKLCRWSDNRY